MPEWKWKLWRFAWSYDRGRVNRRQTMGMETFASWRRVVWKLWWRELVAPHYGRYWEVVEEWRKANGGGS